MNWRLKILAKLILSRFPLGYRTFSRLGLFRHGDMADATYVIDVVSTHLNRLGGAARVAGAVCLELGPGDSLASALIARAMGASRIYLVDVGDFADRDIATYRSLADTLRSKGLAVPDISDAQSVAQMMERLDAVYLTDGLRSLRSLPPRSVDLIWSHAVLEHVRLGEVDDFFRELRRIIRDDGRMSHRIDFMDHLGGSANNLRYSQRVWESEFMASSGFYTNRIRSSDMVRRLTASGFEVQPIDSGRWESLPIPRKRMAAPFAQLDDEDLLTKYIDIVAVPAVDASRT